VKRPAIARTHPAEAGKGPASGAAPRSAAAGPGLLDVLRTPPVLAGLALVLISRAILWALIPTGNEDAYITFRFASNLASGLGPVFNVGERVMGYTSPLWTLWNALGIRLTQHPLEWARATSLLADGVTVLALCGLLERFACRTSSWCFAVMFGAWPYFAAVSVSGMESGAVVALLALAGWQVVTHSRWSWIAVAALALMRPEASACAAVLLVWSDRRARVLAPLLVVAGLGALALYYGDPVPQSVRAKALVYGVHGPLQSRYWWDWLVPFDVGGLPSVADSAQLWSLRLLMAPAMAAGAWSLRRSRALPVALAGLAVWAGYALTGATYFFWYLLLPVTTALYLASAGLPRVVRGPWAYVAAALVVLGTWTYAPRFYWSRAGIEGQMFGDTGMFLNGRARPGDVVLAEPIGIIGWINPSLVIRDEVGLVTPWIAERRTQGPGWYADALAKYDPRWLVVRGSFVMEQTAFAGRSAPFRDSTEFRTRLSRYRLVFATHDPPTANDLGVLERR
jgi:hypothetical protein